MLGRIAVLCITVALLVGGAFYVFRVMFPGAPSVVTTQADLPDAAPPVVKVVAVVEDAGHAAAAVKTRVTGLRVVETNGTLERRGDDGWSTVSQGDTLRVEESVRTGRNAGAVIQVGESGKVRVGSRTELKFNRVDDDLVRVKLQEGRVVAEAPSGGNTLFQVEASGSDAVAETREGRFSVMSDGRGLVAVATETGKVRFKAAGKEVDVAEGQQSIAREGKAPGTPAAIPASLLLKVAPPARTVQRDKEQEVTGQASPGSLVRVKGRTASVDEKGRFRIKVPLEEGPNTVEVVATDVSGREKASAFNVTVDSHAPEIKGSMRWGPQ